MIDAGRRRWVWCVAVGFTFLASSCAHTDRLQTARPAAPTPDITFGGGLAGETIDESAWEAVTSQAQESTVKVSNQGCTFTASGSGFILTGNTIVTNRHVVRGARSLSVETTAGEVVDVDSWRVSTSRDLAIMTLTAPVATAALPVASEPIEPGGLVAVIGYPLGGPLTVGRGRVIKFRGTDEDGPVMEASTDVLPGNSGGPLLNIQGEVVAVVFGLDLRAGSALAIPVTELPEALNEQSTRPGSPC